MSKIYIIGSGGHAKSIASAILSNRDEEFEFVDDLNKNKIFSKKIVSFNEFINAAKETVKVVIGYGNNYKREEIYRNLSKSKYFKNMIFPVIKDKSASIGYNTDIGEGTVILQNSSIGVSSSVGKFCILNTNSSLDHDNRFGNFSSMSPGSNTGGEVEIGDFCNISMGAVIKHCTNLKHDIIVGANSYVNQNIADSGVYFGVPAKKYRNHAKGDNYL